IDAQREHPHARLLACVHAETSTGVENDIAPLAAIADTDTLLVVDTVTSLAGIPVEVDGWRIDACYAGTQKCLGVPPGLAPLTFGERAIERLRNRLHPPQSWYLDLGLIGAYVGGSTRRYHHTAPIVMIYSLHAGLGAVLAEGLDSVWERHRRVGARLQQELPGGSLRPAAREGRPPPGPTPA